MADNFFQEQAINKYKQELVQIIRDRSIAFKAMPLNQAIAVEDKVYTYYKMKEQDNVQYAYELQTPSPSAFASERVPVAMPLHQGDLGWTRHEAMNIRRDIVNVDDRTNGVMAQIIKDQNRTVVYGDANTGTTFSDTTNVSTAITDELDLGTFVEGVEHWHKAVEQLDGLLKDQFDNVPIKVIWTSDVQTRAKSINNVYDQSQSFYDWLGNWLVQYNGGGVARDHIFKSDYLGSNSNAGTLNLAILAHHPKVMELIHSPLEVVQGTDTHKNVSLQIVQRTKPVFYQSNKGVLYGGTCVLTA